MEKMILKLETMKVNKFYFGLCFFIALSHGLLYYNYFQYDPVLARDDTTLILPLKDVGSFFEYVKAVRSNAILDFQPIRDLSFLVNIKIIQLTNISTFHITNFALFILSIFLFIRLLDILGFSRYQIVSSSLIFSAHPIMVSSVGWISARKHSLALVFVLFALHNYFKHKKLTFTSIVFYFLSILSHQIFILFPAWILLHSKIKKQKVELGRFAFMSVFGGTVLVMALGFLKEIGGLDRVNVSYKSFTFMENISRYVISAGRTVVQIFFPVSISAEYYQGSVLGIAGIPVLILFILLLYKSKNREDSLLWISLAVLFHLPIFVTFINDTYIFMTLICTIVSLSYYFKNNPLNINSKIKTVSLIICLFLLMTKTFSASQMWKSDLSLWQYSHKNEGSPYTSIILGSQLLKHNEKLALEMIVWGVSNYDISINWNIFIFFLTSIHSSSLPVQQKIKILSDCYKVHEVYEAFYALTLIEGNYEQMKEGIKRMKPVLEHIKILENQNIKGITIISELRSLCRIVSEKGQACAELGVAY